MTIVGIQDFFVGPFSENAQYIMTNKEMDSEGLSVKGQR